MKSSLRAKQSTVSEKGQTTIPSEIRKVLGIKPGDSVEYEVVGENVVRIHRVKEVDLEWARAIESTLTEWNGDGDDDL